MHPDLQEILHNITTRLAKLEKKQEAPTMNAYENTDKEIWRKIEGDYYSPSIFVTKEENIGISVGGDVYVKSVEEWHKQADQIAELKNARDYWCLQYKDVINKLNAIQDGSIDR